MMQLIGFFLTAAGFASVASAAAAGPYGMTAAAPAPNCKAYTTTLTSTLTHVVSTTFAKTSVQVHTVTSVRVADIPVPVPTTIVKISTIVDTTTSTVATTAVHNATVILTTTTIVTPTPTQFCLSTAAATNLVNGFALLLTDYTTANAEAILAADFTDTSDSINFLGGYPLDSVTFPSRAAFEAGQGSQPTVGFTVDGIDAISCSSIGFRWVDLEWPCGS